MSEEEVYIPREGEESHKELCDACGQMKLIHHKHESGMLVCDKCWEVFFF